MSNAGQGILATREVDQSIEFFRTITRDIVNDPTPDTFDRIVLEAKTLSAANRLRKVPHLLISRAFATIAPDRYHTTVDSPKHDRVIAWFQSHTSFRGTPGNWAHKAAELSQFLSRVPELRQSVLVRNMFPWFVFTQLQDKFERPMFTPGHSLRMKRAKGGSRLTVDSIELRHNCLVEILYAELANEHGKKAVGTEQPSGLGGFVDAVVKLSDVRYWIYEVKVTKTASDAIRQAIGQLLEYGYHSGAWNPEKMFIVSECPVDAESRAFLARLRAEFRMPIEYRRVVLDKNRLKGLSEGAP